MSVNPNGWVNQLGSEEFSIKDSIGGWRGAVESLLPGLVFVIAYVITRDLKLTLILSAGIAILFVVVRLIQRTPITQAFAGVLGVAVGVIWAAMSGRAENYFAWGLITNISGAVIFLLSLIVRRPLVGLIVQLFYGLEPGWRKTPDGSVLARRCEWATWVWFGVFAIRSAAQAPLYFGEYVVALGTVKLILGLPLFALAAWITWVLLRDVLPIVEQKSEEDHEATASPQ